MASRNSTTLGIVIRPLGMQQRLHATSHAPRHRQKTLVQIGLLPFEQRIVLHRVQELAHALGRHAFGQIVGARQWDGGKDGVALVGGLLGREPADGKARVEVRQQRLFVPLDLDPGRVAEDEVEAAGPLPRPSPSGRGEEEKMSANSSSQWKKRCRSATVCATCNCGRVSHQADPDSHARSGRARG